MTNSIVVILLIEWIYSSAQHICVNKHQDFPCSQSPGNNFELEHSFTLHTKPRKALNIASAFLYLIICLGMDERRRATILGMHDRLWVDVTVVRTL